MQLPIERDPGNGVVTVRLVQPHRPVVVLDWALLRAIDAALDQVGPAPKGFVLASDSRVFIAGADLKEVVALSDPDLDEYLAFGQRVFGRIAKLPCTSVAAINGAVLGGGLEIAMHCDHLIAAMAVSKDPAKPAKPYQVGLPEAGLSICPGWGGTNMLPARMDPERAIRMTATGQTFTVVEAREAGLIEELLDDPGRLLPRVRELASKTKAAARETPRCVGPGTDGECSIEMGGLEKLRREREWGQAARAVFECVEIGLKQGWRAALDAERRSLIRLRNTDEGKAAIAAFFVKSGG